MPRKRPGSGRSRWLRNPGYNVFFVASLRETFFLLSCSRQYCETPLWHRSAYPKAKLGLGAPSGKAKLGLGTPSGNAKRGLGAPSGNAKRVIGAPSGNAKRVLGAPSGNAKLQLGEGI